MIIGKKPKTSENSKTFCYDHEKEKWLYGSELNQARENSAIGIVTDEVTKVEMVVVMGGSNFFVTLKSTEYLFVNADTCWSEKWKQGEEYVHTHLQPYLGEKKSA